MGADRRSAPRYRFIADVEVTEIVSEVKLKARTSDLSIGGCFLDMLNPSPRGAEIRVRISHAGTTFAAVGRVAFVIPGMGMGVAFMRVDGDQVVVLQKWLAQAGSMTTEVREPSPKNRRRSQRVWLEVAVLVRVEMPDGKLTQTDAFTSSVNAHGGLLEFTVRMSVGQEFTLINPQTRKEIACRVVRVEGTSEKLFSVAFEFYQHSPQFWPISFPPEDWGVTEKLDV
jgi:PilZ domain-containing protein